MVVVVAGVIIAGFYLAGSPQQARMERFDQRRIQNLEAIAGGIYAFYTQEQDMSKRKLPKNLNELKNTIYLHGELHDPEADIPYEYRVLTQNSYELCATFSTSNKVAGRQRNYYGYQQRRWQHDAGRICFQRQADQLPVYED